MSKRPNVDVRLGSAAEASREALDPDTPFRLLVLGDFGGRGGAPRAVDRDVLDEEIARRGLSIEIALPGGARALVAPRSLDDFHPDRLLESVEALGTFARTRERLGDPRTFEEAAREVRAWAGAAPVPAPAAPGRTEGGSDVVADLLAGAARREKGADAAFRAEVEELVRPHLAPAEDADLPRLSRAVDEACAAALRAVLRDARFRAVEAAWRGLDLLVRRVDDEAVKVFFLDLPREALESDLRAHASLAESALYSRAVTETVETPGAEPWGAILGLYEFGTGVADAALLVRLARIARAAGAPFLAGARPELLGCASIAATPDPGEWRGPAGAGAAVWDEVRALPEAAWVALALPRLLLRLPYGGATDPIDAFRFEELADAPGHEGYLWGNGALACALVLAGAFAVGGWDLRPETAAEVPGLDTHVFSEKGETRVTPPSEVVLTVRAAERILEAGLVPVLSLKGSESVRVARLQAIARPLRALAGRWER